MLVIIPCQYLHSQERAKVIGIKDGDTYVLLKNKRQETVRLHGIDCPEKSQDYGQEAKAYASRIVFGKEVEVIYTGKDRYNRLICILIHGSDTINTMLIQAGMAWHYCKYDKNMYWHSLQKKARNDKIGLWSIDNPLPPWDFRKNNRNK